MEKKTRHFVEKMMVVFRINHDWAQAMALHNGTRHTPGKLL